MASRPTTHRRARSITSLVRRQESCGPTVLSILVSAYQVRWRAVEERLYTHSSEAAIVDSAGYTILYRALIRRIDDYPPYPIVRSIIRAYPLAIWDRYGKSTLLEIACSRLVSLETLTLLTSARPSIPEDSSALNVLWETYCKRYGDEVAFVRVLQSESNEALDIGCKFQLLLKYLSTEYLLPCNVRTAAASDNCSLSLFRLFVTTMMDQFYTKPLDGVYPIHASLSEAINSKNNIEKAQYILQEFPEQHMAKNKQERLPLHFALEIGCVHESNMTTWIPTDKPEILLTPNPETGLYPFQTAALASPQASGSVLYRLLRAAPSVLVERRHLPQKTPAVLPKGLATNREYMSPALRNLLNSADENGLLDELQKTLRAPADESWHQLLGVAQVFCCPPKLVELLIDMHPEMLLQPDQHGMLPLHHAVAAPHREQSDTLGMLLRACPAAAGYCDKYNRTPLHLASLVSKGTWIIDLLRPHYPDAIYQLDRCHRLPPVLLAAQNPKSTLDLVYHLLMLGPDIIKTT